MHQRSMLQRTLVVCLVAKLLLVMEISPQIPHSITHKDVRTAVHQSNDKQHRQMSDYCATKHPFPSSSTAPLLMLMKGQKAVPESRGQPQKISPRGQLTTPTSQAR